MVYVDANVILEVLLNRALASDCSKYIDESKQDVAISLLTLSIVMYVLEKDKIGLSQKEYYLRQFSWLPITQQDAEWSYGHYNSQDFEDGVQVSCALREKCTRFVTLDKRLAAKYGSLLPIDLITI